MEIKTTLQNKHGEKIIFTKRADNEGEYYEAENFVQPGAGTPMHVHWQQEEGLTVLSGSMQLFTPEKEWTIGEGESVCFKPGQYHKFRNAGDTLLHCRGYIRPCGNIVYFLEQVYRSSDNSRSGRPDPFDMAYLLFRYRDEVDMAGIPPLARKMLFPLLRGIGRLLGKFRKYAGAPDPVKSSGSIRIKSPKYNDK